MARKLFLFNLFILPLFFATCNSLEPPPPDEKPTLSLTLEDASCIEAWINLTTSNLQFPATVTLKQSATDGNTVTQDIVLSYADTLLYIDSLLPNQTYTFQASMQPSNHTEEVKSNELGVATLDTTSHNFTFETWTFGEVGSSTLYDVAIIDENNIWAVGDIMIADTSINGYTTYNAVHWDGLSWSFHRIMFQTICGQPHQSSYPASSIFVFDGNDIWIAMDGDQVARLNGSTQIANYCLPVSFSVKKLWGESSSSLYAVGTSGNIVYYNGTLWRRIESGTDSNIGDIWGIPIENGGFIKYLAAVDKLLIIEEGNTLQTVSTEQGHTLSSVWGKTERLLYTAGGFGVALYKNYKWENMSKPDVNTIYNVRGQAFNEVFGLSSTFSILHFNGYSWQYINTGTSNIYYRQDVKDDLVVAVGWQGDKAVITIIRRNQ